MSRLFDAYVMVDWSAEAKPKEGKDSIWIGVLKKDSRFNFELSSENPRTRLEARERIADIVTRLNKRRDRVLLGFDFSLGYPAGTAKALGRRETETADWRLVWNFLSDRLKDRADNSKAADRFAVAASMNYAISGGPFPFWGAPKTKVLSTLSATKSAFTQDSAISEHRLVETHLKARKFQPKSVWQIGGIGSVGSQTMMGIPHVDALSGALAGAKIWPFETGLVEMTQDTLQEIPVVICEVYPSLVAAKPRPGQVPDEAQVEAIARHYCDLDGHGKLGPLFSGLATLTEAEKSQITREEGWILGA